MTEPTVSLIIPTTGRVSLKDALESLMGQPWCDGDQVIVVCDGDWRVAVEWFAGRHVSFDWCLSILQGPHRDWGGAARTRGLKLARAGWLAFLDDDDWWVENSLLKIRDAIEAMPDHPHFFRMARPGYGDLVWRSSEAKRSNVSLQNFICPNWPKSLGKFTSRYEADWDFIESTLALMPPLPLGAWHDDVICYWGRTPGTPEEENARKLQGIG